MADLIQVTETENEGLKRAYTVVVDARVIGEKIDEQLAEVGKTAKMAGFRPGKIPPAVLKKRYGPSVTSDVLQDVVAESSRELFKERGIRPALQPKIEITAYDDGKNLEYTMQLECFPTPPAFDFATVSLEKIVVSLEENDVLEGVERVLKANKSFEPKGEGAVSEEGDVAIIDFVGKIDGVPFEGGAATDFRLELGSGQFIEGFESQLIGKKVGDEVAVNVTFPEKYHSESLAGKPAVFDVTMKDILKPAVPVLSDEFAARIGFESAEKLKEAVKKQIEKDYTELSRSRAKKELFDALDEAVRFDVPQGMVDLEFNSLFQQVSRDRQSVPEYKDKSDDELKDELKKMADRRVRLGILLAELGRENNISVEQDELRRAVYEQARMYPGQERKVIEFYQNNQESLEQLKGPILEEKVVDFLLEKVNIKEKALSAKELLAYFSSMEGE